LRRKLRFHPRKPNLKPQFSVGKSPAKKVGGYRSYPVTTPTGVYQPSLRSPWLAASAERAEPECIPKAASCLPIR
ncbi:hypothetical protein, partial [Thiolapillus sp.]